MKVTIYLVDRLGIVTDKHVNFPQKNNPLFDLHILIFEIHNN
jgi:hypothetical protein